MKCIVNKRPEIDEKLIKPFREMEDVYSISCVVGDAIIVVQLSRQKSKHFIMN